MQGEGIGPDDLITIIGEQTVMLRLKEQEISERDSEIAALRSKLDALMLQQEEGAVRT